MKVSDTTLNYSQCILCKSEFSELNVYSEEGWRETQLSGMCELCFDKVTLDSEEFEREYEST